VRQVFLLIPIHEDEALRATDLGPFVLRPVNEKALAEALEAARAKESEE